MDTLELTWSADAEALHETGFAHAVRRRDGGVGLFDLDLVADDGPGSGLSEKGPWTDAVWGQRRARKQFALEDGRASGACLVVFIPCGLPAHERSPLQVAVNGHDTSMPFWDWSRNGRFHAWLSFPAEWLTAGTNVVELSCPQAERQEDAWTLCLARADEFGDGGGDVRGVGQSSCRSDDGGATWRPVLDAEEGVQAEYSIRLSLDRHVRDGWIATPVVDLWRGAAQDFVTPLRAVQRLQLSGTATVPDDTSVEYFLRLGEEPSPLAGGWSAYESLGAGSSLDVELDAGRVGRRYAQLKAILTTANPLVSPVLRSVRLHAGLEQRVPDADNIAVVAVDNPPLRYPTVDWEWEEGPRPEFDALRRREGLDEILAGCRTQLEAQVRLCDHVTRRWSHCDPVPEYPAWDAASILDRVGRLGGGGMCVQFNLLLAGLCTACGWQARLTVVSGHEICEVWNDDFGKWIFFDADFHNNYNCDVETGEPLSMLELHERHLDYYYPGRAIDFMEDPVYTWRQLRDEPPPVRRGSPTGQKRDHLTGFCNAAYMHLVPRTNWFGQPTPRPLTQGKTDWPWNGYVAWYDERTPPRRQYDRHTDRPQDLWPDLNRVHVHATSGLGNDRLYLSFETYTPSFDRFEVDVDDTGWKPVEARWTWLLQAGCNRLRVRAVNRMGARGKPSSIELNHVNEASFARA